jgi:antitoxin ParD1/3/4
METEMSNTTKANVTLRHEQAALVSEVVDSGEYDSAEDVVAEALTLWRQDRMNRQQQIEGLQTLWDEGKASGQTASVDFAELRREARRALAAASGHGD